MKVSTIITNVMFLAIAAGGLFTAVSAEIFTNKQKPKVMALELPAMPHDNKSLNDNNNLDTIINNLPF